MLNCEMKCSWKLKEGKWDFERGLMVEWLYGVFHIHLTKWICILLQDLCRCTIFYADLMCKKVEEMEKGVDEKYNISDEVLLLTLN